MHAEIRWDGATRFTARAGSGHEIVIDGPPELGGVDAGARPMEMVLIGTGACSAVDVMMILKKARQDVTDCRVRLDAERATGEPKVFTHIRMVFIVTGRGLNPGQVERAVKLSAEKYCSASIMLGRAGVEIVHGVELRETPAGTV